MYNLIETLVEIFQKIKLLLSPTILGIVFGLIIYNCFTNLAGLILGIVIVFIGFLIGIAWVTDAFSINQTIRFLSRAFPNASDKEKNRNSKKNKNYR